MQNILSFGNFFKGTDIAPEVYMRIVQNRKAFEKQYMVTGEADYQEKTVGVNYPIII